MKLHPCNLILITVIVLSSWTIAADPTTSSVAPDEALSRLKAGNERFATSKESASKPVAARRAETAKDQHPFAIIVGCADSRTASEIVFHHGPLDSSFAADRDAGTYIATSRAIRMAT